MATQLFLSPSGNVQHDPAGWCSGTDILIRNGVVVTQDAQRRIVEGNVWIEDGRVADIGKVNHTSDAVVDAGGGIVMPGLINTHTHVAMTEFRGMVDDIALDEFLSKTFELDAHRTESSIRESTKTSLREMLLGGTTSFLDLYYGEDIIAEVCRDFRIRSFLSWVVLDEDKTTQKGRPIANAERFVRNFSGGGLITPTVGLQGVYVCSRDTCDAARSLAMSRKTLLHMHLAETRHEVYDHQKRTGSRPVEWLNSFSFFSDCDVVGAHGAWLTKAEICVLKKHGVSISHCARSNMKLGSGIAPVVELKNEGVCVSIGTDSATTSNNLDMFEEMRVASLLQKVNKWDAGIMNAQTVLDMTTREAARSLRREDVMGSIEEGKRADVIVLDSKSPRLHPLTRANAVNSIVYSAQGGDVVTTIVDGAIVVDDRKLLPVK